MFFFYQVVGKCVDGVEHDALCWVFGAGAIRRLLLVRKQCLGT